MELRNTFKLLAAWLLIESLPAIQGTLATKLETSDIVAKHWQHRAEKYDFSSLYAVGDHVQQYTRRRPANKKPKRHDPAGISGGNSSIDPNTIAKESLGIVAFFINQTDFNLVNQGQNSGNGSDAGDLNPIANQVLATLTDEIKRNDSSQEVEKRASRPAIDGDIAKRAIDISGSIKELFNKGLDKALDKLGSLCVTNMAVDIGFAAGKAVADKISSELQSPNPSASDGEEKASKEALAAFSSTVSGTNYNELLAQLTTNAKLQNIDLNRAARQGLKSYQATLDRTFLARLPRSKLNGKTLSADLTERAITQMACSVAGGIVEEASGVTMSEAQELADGLVGRLTSQANEAASDAGIKLS